MCKDNSCKILLLGIFFLFFLSIIHSYISIQENTIIRKVILIEEAKSITHLFKSFRSTYLHKFINHDIKIDKKTIELLPVKTSNEISATFAQSLNAKVILRTVSDNPRNPVNIANKEELEIIRAFEKSGTKEYIFKDSINHIYKYYEPLYITKACLTCHGKVEDAPKIIQENYTEAFGYKLGELRGIISLEIDKSYLLTKIDTKNNFNLLYILVTMLLLISTVLFFYFKLKKSHEKSKKLLMSKNNFLQRKSKEFDDLQNALGVSEIISKTDVNGIILSVNDKFCEVSGYTREEAIGKTHSIIRHPDTDDKVFKKMWSTIESKNVFKCILKNRTKDGDMYHVDSTIVPILDEAGIVLEYIAFRHTIDNLMNQKLLLQDMIKSSEFSALVIAKIDGFEELENFYNSNTITQLEKKIEETILKAFPDNCLFNKVYRLENGEFAFIRMINSCEEFINEKTSLIKEFQENIKKRKYSVDGYEFNIGVLVSFSTGKDDIFENAKLGLKELIRGDKYIINADGLASQIRIEMSKNIETINMIKLAIEKENILSFYQPLYNNKTKKIEKYESLVRLKTEDDKILSPYFFLEASKKGGYYNQITKIVIENSFAMLDKIDEDMSISINISFLDIESDETREFIYNVIDNSSKCHRVIIELLEDETAKNFELIKEFIQVVKSKGIKIAIDDFGSGYSNFERLLEYQPDILKIDGSLIKNIVNDNFSRNIVETIVSFAKKQDMQVIAEYIENEAIFDIINELDIEFSQGYYIGKPEPL